MYEDGEQSRAFGNVSDVVRAPGDLSQHPQAVGEVFDIGNTQEITINVLAQRIKQMTGSVSDIIHVPYDRAYEKGFEDMRRRAPDISKIQRPIGYQPTVDLDRILARVIADFRDGEEPEFAAAEKSA